MAPWLTAFVLLFVATGLVGAVSRRLGGKRAPEGAEKRSGLYLGLVHAGSMLAGALFPWLGVGALPLGEAFAWGAVGAMVLALAFQLWSMATLGPWFTLTLQADADQPVCERGPYRLVRHPGYLGQILFWIAFALACRSAIVLALVVVGAALGYGYRIRVEERLLCEALGARWDAYANGRARLLPGIW